MVNVNPEDEDLMAILKSNPESLANEPRMYY